RHHDQHARVAFVGTLFRQPADGVPAVAARHRGAAELEHDPAIGRKVFGHRNGRAPWAGHEHAILGPAVAGAHPAGIGAAASAASFLHPVRPRQELAAETAPTKSAFFDSGATRATYTCRLLAPPPRPPMPRPYLQLDVFADRPGAGNPLAVVLDARGLDAEAMHAIARWARAAESTSASPQPPGTAAHPCRL